MILGDSLYVMASLATREGLKGKVQCIYIDPPYGIKFNSNWQVSTASRDVTDGKREDVSREPEQVKAFRDTWKDSIHSYLTYLRDRLTVAKELLTESGSIFIQIWDENVHRVRAVMDEVTIRDLEDRDGQDNYAGNLDKLREKHPHARLFALNPLKSGGYRKNQSHPFRMWNRVFPIGDGQCWKHTVVTDSGETPGMDRLGHADRLFPLRNDVRFIRYAPEPPASRISNWWDNLGGASTPLYVVQTNSELVKRCILMTTDPGDLVLDPTCGSGTTAYVAEQWGRRWITVDTSRVALALARARIMGARYPYYFLADTPEGRRKDADITGKRRPRTD